ncbi:unnamed protein product [Blumeria hordei]|uniref:Uncharacterized protein n=2 Tax=Blumeria hordei TaxID=2867405 RepID=A0A383UUA1_BLUHO|nr:hypothetical protein BGHDH14_bgh05635 [Blumeria hordei DH14]SZF03165.1 unnamed protein product [Blumeria hordei]
MNKFKPRPEALLKLMGVLEPFVKTRQEVTRIRRILRLLLISNLQAANDQPTSYFLSIPESSLSQDPPRTRMKGRHGEYLRCLQANIKARNEHLKLSMEHNINSEDESHSTSGTISSSNQDDANSVMESYIDLLRKRHKRERLRLIRDNIETLFQKPAASNQFLNPKETPEILASVPKVPSELMQQSDIDRDSVEEVLEDMVIRLEKSILRAKIILKREQTLNSEVRVKTPVTCPVPQARLFALSSTRDELINWIESELARVGENSGTTNKITLGNFSHQEIGSVNVDDSLRMIKGQYSGYVAVRQLLVDCLHDSTKMPFHLDDVISMTTEPNEERGGFDSKYNPNPCLNELAHLTTEIKQCIQHKSYLISSLGKQHEQTVRDFERLAQESHLLLSHPNPLSKTQRDRLDHQDSFVARLSSRGKPDLSFHAQAWVHAARSASHTITETVVENIENGLTSAANALHEIKNLKSLVGIDSEHKDNKVRRDIWEGLNGNLGAIKEIIGEIN